MENKEIWKNAQPWERELAEVMCSENLQLLKEQFYGQDGDKKPDMKQTEQFYMARYRMLDKTVGIIRESMMDREGKPLLDPQQWMEKTKDMDETELKTFQKGVNATVRDDRRNDSYNVPASLADNFTKLSEVGIRVGSAISGRVVDQPNHRDSHGFPYMLSGLGRPLAMLTFDVRDVPGSWRTLNRSQMQDVTWGAREAGWRVENWNGEGLSILLPLTNSGLTFEQVSEKVNDKLYEKNPEWRNSPDWLTAYRREYKDIVRQEGGRIMYTDRDIADAWNKLTEAIVRNVQMRWQRENPRVSDIQVGRKLETDKQTVQHTIRCRIDGEMQMSKPLHKLDGGRYDTAVHVGDEQKLNDLKRELAVTYFSEELRMNRNQNQTIKR